MFYIEKTKFKLTRYTFNLSNIYLFSKKKIFKVNIKKNSFIKLYLLFSYITKDIKLLFNILYTYFKHLWYLLNNYLNLINQLIIY